MNKKQIVRFVRKVNYGVPIKVCYFSNKRYTCAAAQVLFTRTLNKDGSINVWSRIEVNKAWKKHLKDVTIKSALLHEVGHLYTGFVIKKKKVALKPGYLREYEANIWAMKRARSLKMYGVRRRILQGFKEWEQFDWNSKHQIYKKAWKIAVKNGIIKLNKE